MTYLRLFSFSFLFSFSLLFLACQQPEKPEETLTSLEGSWSLVKFIPDGSTEWQQYSDSILYQKHLTADQFVWFNYDLSSNKIIGMGGGTYSIIDSQYVEKINFFFPPGSSELGQAIPFDFELKGRNWYHTGFAKQMSMDPETGSMIASDSSKIEEVWRKTDLPENERKELVGAWDLVAYRDSVSGEYTEYPDFIGYIKLITPTHFAWVNYDWYGDEIYAAGSGPYQFDSSTYTETLAMIFPDNGGQINQTVTFKSQLNGSNWKHFGHLPVVSIDSSTGNIMKDSALVDEKWKIHQQSTTDGITF